MENKNDIMEYIMRLARASRRKLGTKQHMPRWAFRITQVLNEQGAIRTSDLAEKLDIRPASLTEALSKMEQHGLVNRKKDTADSRMVIVSLTEKGTAELEANKQTYQAMSDKLLQVLSAEEQEQFCAIGEKLIAFFESEMPQGTGMENDRGHMHHGFGHGGRHGKNWKEHP